MPVNIRVKLKALKCAFFVLVAWLWKGKCVRNFIRTLEDKPLGRPRNIGF